MNNFVVIVSSGAAGFWNLVGWPSRRFLAAVSSGYRANGVQFRIEPMDDGTVPAPGTDRASWATRYKVHIEAPNLKAAKEAAWDEFGIGMANSIGLHPMPLYTDFQYPRPRRT